MGKINAGRVVLGGLAAGVIISLGEWLASIVFAPQYDAMYQSMGVAEPGGSTLALFVVFTFLIGALLVWLYAAVRPRLGPGPRTALCAGFAVWFLAWLWPTVSWVAIGGIDLTIWMLVALMLWALVEVELSAVVGGWVYKESEDSAPATAV